MASVGDIALAPSDPKILYVGTGEPNNRQSSSFGAGVYKSTDGGENWTRFDDGGLKGLFVQAMAPGSAQMADLFVLTENQGVLAYRPDLASGSRERAVAEVNR